MIANLSYDVAIIGFGPVGAIASALLGQSNWRVLALDKSRVIYDKPRAIALDHEIMRVLQGLGIAHDIAPLTAPFTLSEHFGADGHLIRRVGMLPPPYPMGWTPSMAFLQPQVEQVVRDLVARTPSVDVRLGVELTDLVQKPDLVTLTICDEAGSAETITARYVIGCDGASSTVRDLVKIPLEDLGFDEPWLVIDLLVNDRGRHKLPQVSSHFCEPDRPSLFVVGTGNHRRFEMMLLPGENASDMEREDQVWALLSRWITPQDAELWRYASYRFHALVARDWRHGRVFLAGDAAHQQPPFLGQGMCQGVRDVSNLAWKLGMVLSGDADDKLLETYAEERSEHVRALTAIIKQVGSVICELDPAAAQERDLRLRAQYAETTNTLVRQEMMPPLRSGLLANSSDEPRGLLFPQPQVTSGGNLQLLDDAVGGGWRVVLAGEAVDWQPKSELPVTVIRITTRLDDHGLQETDRIVADWMVRYGCVAVIVRPDHYVYAGCSSLNELDHELVMLSQSMRSKSTVEQAA